MRLITHLAEFHAYRRELAPHLSIGLVPTMGALHAGHASLVERSVKENDISIVSIFVNPTQFGPHEDFERYPRNLDADCAYLATLGVDVVFAPLAADIYPQKDTFIQFRIRQLADKLCAVSRPRHMEGVVQVVSILFHLTRPDKAYFGLKDFQQFTVLQHMVKELHFPLEVVGCPIVREVGGLAMSSRNVYLNHNEREQALSLSTTLRTLRSKHQTFDSVTAMKQWVQKELARFDLVRLDYFEVLDPDTLLEIQDFDAETRMHAFIAAYLGQTRLIDNLALTY